MYKNWINLAVEVVAATPQTKLDSDFEKAKTGRGQVERARGKVNAPMNNSERSAFQQVDIPVWSSSQSLVVLRVTGQLTAGPNSDSKAGSEMMPLNWDEFRCICDLSEYSRKFFNKIRPFLQKVVEKFSHGHLNPSLSLLVCKPVLKHVKAFVLYFEHHTPWSLNLKMRVRRGI
ncbi:4378_t:CDS:2 [Acaulospora colombiana]|uniref:4378_t:CDS:1 n=1 Tax=Acaulospora colombiana TaxID=27376 RepID=A0ACA9NNI0_9GLOM|nr:4378_t:CDS:2 [Acaulospora colombiana]